MPEMMNQMECLTFIVEKRKRLLILESLQIIKDLLNEVEPYHKEDKLFLKLSPDHIWLKKENEEYVLAVDMDGVHSQSAVEKKERLESLKSCVGFRAAEIALRDYSRIGKKSDYYAVAAVFYYCMTGRKISRLQMFRSEIPDISDVIAYNHLDPNARRILCRILKKGLAPELRNRYQNLNEMRSDLKDLEEYIKMTETEKAIGKVTDKVTDKVGAGNVDK